MNPVKPSSLIIHPSFVNNLDVSSSVNTVAPITSFTTPLSPSLQPVQNYEVPQETAVKYSFFYKPCNDFQIYHITFEEISLSYEGVSQLINHTNNSYVQSNNIYTFYHEQPEVKKIYKVNCEMISHTLVFQLLNKIVYDIHSTQGEYYQQEFSKEHQENLEFYLKKDLIHYLIPKKVEENYDLHSNQDCCTYSNTNTDVQQYSNVNTTLPFDNISQQLR